MKVTRATHTRRGRAKTSENIALLHRRAIFRQVGESGEDTSGGGRGGEGGRHFVSFLFVFAAEATGWRPGPAEHSRGALKCAAERGAGRYDLQDGVSVVNDWCFAYFMCFVCFIRAEAVSAAFCENPLSLLSAQGGSRCTVK